MEQTPKKNKRKLSRFLCQEMLYDFVSERLDANRREAIREFLASDEQSREELECLREGISYCERLALTTVSQPLLEKLKKSQSLPSKTFSQMSWKALPTAVRLGLEALCVSVAVAVVMSAIPWGHLHLWRGHGKGEVEITSVAVHKDSQNSEGPFDHQAESPQAEREVASTAEPATPEPAPQPATSKSHEPPRNPPPAVVKTPGQVVAESPAAEPPATKDNKQKLEASSPPKPADVPPSAVIGPDAKEIAADTADPGEDPKRYIFKVFMKMGDLDTVSPKVADSLRKTGAQRAGEVDLGWRRPTGSYYHFTIPVTNYKDTIKALQSFGPVRIFREPHRRLMPEGKIRFILWIEEEK